MRQDNKKKGSGKQPARKHTKREESAHLWHFESMDRVNQAMQGTNDLEEMMKRVLDTLLSVFECDRAFLVYPCDPEADTWQVPMERTRPEYPGALPIGIEMPLTPPGAEVFRNLRAANGPVRFGPGLENEVDPDIRQNFRIQSYIAMALYPKIGKPWSFGLHQCSYARAWTTEEERLFQEIGRRLADSLSILLAFRNTQESEKRIKQLIDASPVAMVVSSGDDERVEWVNEKFIELFGYTVDDMPDVEHWWPLAYPDEAYRAEIRMRWEASAEQAIREMGEISPMEATVRCKDGSQRHIEFRLSSIGEKHLVIFVDLTERKQAEDELRQNREVTLQFSEQLAALQEVTNELSKAKSSDDLCLQAVQLGRSRLGFDRVSIWFIEEHLGIMRGSFGTDERGELRDERNAQVEFRHEGLSWLLFSHKESRASVDHSPLYDHLGSVVGEGDNAMAALWDGGEVIGVISVDNLFTGQPISEHQLEVLRLYATALGHLITRKRAEEALRESEEKYRTLIQKIRAAVVVHGADTQILTSNSMAQELLGLTEDQMLGKTSIDLAWNFLFEDGTTMPPEKYPVNLVLGSHKPLRNFIAGVHRPGNENDVWVLVNADPIFGKEGEITQVIVTFIDITERKRVESALHEQERHSQSLLRLSRRLEQAQTYSDVLNAAQDEVRDITGYQNLFVYLFTPDKKQAKALFAKGPISDMVMAEDEVATLSIEGDRMLEELVETKEVLVVEDARTDERTNKQIVAKMGIRTMIGVPILLFDRLMGSIGTGTYGDEGVRIPTASECEYMIAVASHMAVTLDRIHLLTERRQAEEALRKSEQRYHSLFEDSSISIWEEDFSLVKQSLDLLRQEGVKDFAAYFNDHPELLTEYASQIKVVDINNTTLKMFEASTKSELLENVVRVIKNDDFGIFREELVKIANGELDFQWEEPNQTLAGNQIYIHFRWTVVPGFEDTLSRVMISIIDITQRKQAEEALYESQWRYREVFDNVLDSLYLLEVTEDGRFRNLEINPAFEKSTGLSRTQLIGKFIEETVPEETASIVNAKYRRCVETGHPIEEEVELDLPAGRRYFHSTLIPARDETGRIHRIIGISRDITERKQAEMALSRERELLRTLVDNLPEEVYVKDRERRFLFVNELLVRALGAQSMDEVIGKRDEDFWPPYLAKQFADEENELMRTGKPLLNDEHSPPHESGPKRWLLRTKLPLRDGAGNIIGLAGLNSDITERKQTEQVVRESEERLRQIASSLREVVWLRDAKTRQVLYVNPAFQELTGRTCESFYENRDLLRDAIHPDDRKEVTKALDQRSPSVPFDTEHRIIHLNGNVRWVSSKSFAVRNEAGEVYRWATIMEDITERKLATESLRESERRLVAAQHMAHVGYWERDFDTNRVALSDEACRIFGIPEQGLSLNLDEWHPRWVALIHPEDQPRLIKLLGDVLAGIRSYNVEYRVIRPDGAVRFIYSQAEVKRDVSGHAHNMLGMMQDITERKQAEQALRASENRFRVLSENAFVGIYIIQDGRLSYVNSTLAKIFGYTPEELTGAEPALVIHPDDRAMVAENIRRRIVGEIETIHYEFRGRCKDGGTRNIEVLGGRIDFGGKTAVIGNLMDITDRKRAEDEIARSLAAEKKARKVAEILREANESLSRTLHLEDVLQNLLQYLLQLVPYDSANVMLREGDTQFRAVALRGYEHWTNLDATRNLVFDIHTIPSLNELVTTQKSIIIENTYEYLGWVRVPGTEHVVSWLGIPIITDGQVIGLYSVDKVETAFFTDEHRLLAEGLAAQAAVAIQNTRLHDQITRANVELEQRVASRTAQLEEANKELEAFAYSVSHDLRAPLRHVDGFIDMLQKRTKTTLDDKSRHYMEVIADSANKMGTLIDDLLSFSRMGRTEMSKSQVDLGELVEDVVRELRPEAAGRDIQWTISPLPLVTGDQAMLRIVLVNLVSNALKFTRSRKIAQIEIGCERKNETEAVIFIRDNGVGFEMNYVDKLFGVFQRLHRQEDFEGTGIGLANVRRIINRHGGRAWADGQVDQGATFYFSLPQSIQGA